MEDWHRIRSLWHMMSSLVENGTEITVPALPEPVEYGAALGLLKQIIASSGWRYSASLGVVFSFGLLSLLPAELFRYFTESTQALDLMNAEEFLVRLGFFGLSVALAVSVSAMGTSMVQEWLRVVVESRLRRRVLRRLHAIPLTVLDSAQRGDWLTRMTGDLRNAESFLIESIPRHTRHSAIFFGIAILFIQHTGALALVPLAAALILAGANVVVQNRVAPVVTELSLLHGGVFQLLAESLESIRTIRSHQVETFVARRFDERLSAMTSKSFKMVRRLGLLLGATEFVGQILIAACLCLAVWALTIGQLSMQGILIYPFFLGLFYRSAKGLASAAYDWNRFCVEGGRLAPLLLDEDSSTFEEGPSIPTKRVATLELVRLCVGHPNGQIMGPVSVRLSVGEIWAVMGPSGCGKSTFLEVIAGLRPGLSGTYNLKDQQKKILSESDAAVLPNFKIDCAAYVEQRPYIFDGSLRENLVFGNPNRLSDTVIWKAVEQAGLSEFATGRGGLSHILNDRGSHLSQGDRYRIALCRALLVDRPFLFLDEPFAAIDEVSVMTVIGTLQSLRLRRGILVVTHHLPENFSVDGLIRFETSRIDVRANQDSERQAARRVL